MRKVLVTLTILATSLGTVAQHSQNLDSLFHWDDTTIIGSWAFDNAYNEVWGMVVNGREFAVIGTTDGTHIFDVTKPDSSTMVAYVAGAEQGSQIIHRDYHDYAGYLYAVADEGTASTLQIIDISTLPDSVSVVYDSDNLFRRAHNIFIDTATAKLYACAVKDSATSYPMNIYSLANPASPAFLYTYPDVGHVHDVYVWNDTAYCNNGPDALTVVDFTSGSSHTLLGSLTTYPDKGYNHSGWLNEDGTIYIFADENHGHHLKVCDVTDLTNITVVSTIYSNVHADSSMAHNLIIKGDSVYVSYYHDGLRIYDISDPANPVARGWFDTYLRSDHQSYRGNWGVYCHLPSGNLLASDMQSGLWVFGMNDSIPPIMAPVAMFTYTDTNLDASFTDLSTNMPTSWSWDFDDGSALDTNQHTTHTFPMAGTYNVCLTAMNGGGSDTWCDSVSVSESPSGTGNIAIDNVVVYPNPLSGNTISVRGAAGRRLRVVDMLGRVLVERTIETGVEHIALPHTGNGILTVLVVNERSTKAYRLIRVE